MTRICSSLSGVLLPSADALDSQVCFCWSRFISQALVCACAKLSPDRSLSLVFAWVLPLTGACFGKDVILSNNNLRDVGDAIALTFVQTISLTQKDIFDLLPDYPMAYLVIRRAALGMALARALVKAAEIVKKSRLMASGRRRTCTCHSFPQTSPWSSAYHIVLLGHPCDHVHTLFCRFVRRPDL